MSNTAHLNSLAARAGARIQRLSQELQERYPNPEIVITQEEAEQHLMDYGHTYDANCTAEFCTKWRSMVDGAMSQMRGS